MAPHAVLSVCGRNVLTRLTTAASKPSEPETTPASVVPYRAKRVASCANTGAGSSPAVLLLNAVADRCPSPHLR